MKMHPLFDLAIAGVLRADPTAVVILLRSRQQLAWQRRLRDRLISCLDNDEQLMRRVVFVSQLAHRQYMQLLCGLDVSLDPFPFGGGVTLCDSTAGSCASAIGTYARSGVAFVTSGELQSVHRIGLGLSKAINSTTSSIADTIISTHSFDNFSQRLNTFIDAYIREAVRIAQDSLRQKFNGSNRDARKDSNESEYFVIHQSLAAVKEWELFLSNAYLNR